MEHNLRMEQFSRAYVHALAATVGYGCTRPEVDDDSIDMIVSATGGSGTRRSPRLELQLKSHAMDLPTGPSISYPLKVKNYNELRVATFVPRILVLVVVPRNIDEWTKHSEEQLVLRRCGYWLSLHGMEETTNASSVTVTVPRTQVFNVEALRGMMERISAGDMP